MLAPLGFRDLLLCGSGATSRVYRATEARTGETVALKRLHRQLVDSPDALSRLRREFEALNRLRHPSIAAVRDVIRWQGDPTLVMEFIDGVDLKEEVRRCGTLSGREVERVARAMLDVLAAAHGAGIVHRDVKPQNIRLGSDGRIFLLDFGSARFEASSQLTKTGTTMGTPEYMAPELFAGSVYDPRVDIYSLGATLFECLTGRLPHEASSLTELAFKRTKERAPAVQAIAAGVPVHLAQMVDRCLSAAPEDRFSTATLAAWALDHPDEERAFRMRRAQEPPCLHCGAAIPPESVVCGGCRSEHPFSYAPGSSHVVLRSVKDPAELLLEMRSRFPERASRAHLVELAQRCAALAYSRQRLISFIDKDEARHLADSLGAAGIQCDVEEDRGTSRWPAVGLMVLALFVCLGLAGSMVVGEYLEWSHLLLAALGAGGALVLGRAAAVAESEKGILTDRRLPAPVLARVPGALVVGAVGIGAAALALPGFALALLARRDVTLTGYQELASLSGPLLFSAAVALVAGLLAWRVGFRRPLATGAGSAEPGLWVKAKQAFVSRAQGARNGVGGLMVAAVLCLVPAELVALSAVRTVDGRAIRFAWYSATGGIGRWFGRAASPFTEAWNDLVSPEGPRGAELTEAPQSLSHIMVTPMSPYEPGPGDCALHPERCRVERLRARVDWAPDVGDLEAARPSRADVDEADVTSAEQETSRFAFRNNLVRGGALLGALLMVVAALRRRRTIRAEARRILAEVDVHGRLLLVPKLVPRSRAADLSLGLADLLARNRAGNAFQARARLRSVELAHCLPRAEAEALKRAVASLQRRGDEPKDDLAEASLLERCILETDEEQKLRFEFLALEGRMEAEAAMHWASAIAQEDGR